MILKCPDCKEYFTKFHLIAKHMFDKHKAGVLEVLYSITHQI